MRVVFAALCCLVLASAPVAGQGCINTACSMGICTLTATAPNTTTMGGLYTILVVQGVTNGGMASNASCAPATGSVFDLAAPLAITLMANRTAGPPASCSWAVVVGRSMGGVANFNCSVDESDGLPVELMEFTVEDSDQEAAPDEEGTEQGS